MPDLATHLAAGYLVAETRRGVGREIKALASFGQNSTLMAWLII
jgi:hypothetical protein